MLPALCNQIAKATLRRKGRKKEWQKSSVPRLYAVSALVSGKKDGRSLRTDERGEAYIGEAVKILIAVVIGGLLLTLVYSLMKDTVFPTVTQKIQTFFGYTA